ncbi:MAG: hypothetical protein DDT19_01513 [Syntrophomonadaceae bacterium]|nr:hypothetical protein [Bacillota bacterium]
MGRWLEMFKTQATPRQVEPVDYRHEGQKARELLSQQGWCAVRSKALGGEVVIWAKDGVAIPAEWRGTVIYTMAELTLVADTADLTPAKLRQIHEAKKVFNGTAVQAHDT